MNFRFFFLAALSAIFAAACAPTEHVARKGVHVLGHGVAKTGHVVSRAGDKLESHGDN